MRERQIEYQRIGAYIGIRISVEKPGEMYLAPTKPLVKPCVGAAYMPPAEIHTLSTFQMVSDCGLLKFVL